MYLTMNQSLPDQRTAKKTIYFRNEWVLRVFATPLIAIFYSSITPLVYKTDPSLSLLLNYCYFTFIFHLIWSGNRWLLIKQGKRNYWIKKPVLKAVSLFFIHLFYSFFLSFFLLYIWNNVLIPVSVPVNRLLLASFIVSIIAILITFLFEVAILITEKSIDLLKTEKLKNEKIQAELDTLKSQIDPHFIFNSLNTLSELISGDKEKALLFNENLAKVYRYILANRSNDLVTAKEEVDFINSYFLLLKIRFEDSLTINMNINNLDLNSYYLPTIALQTAIENAIKHNQFSSSRPLSISVEFSGDYAIISNNITLLKYKVPSSGVGLINLDNRYKLILNKSIHIDETPDCFSLYLPIVKNNL